MMRPGDVPHEISDDIGEYTQEVDDTRNVGKVWDDQMRQYEGEHTNILAIGNRKAKYPSVKQKKVDPSKCVGERDGFYEVN